MHVVDPSSPRRFPLLQTFREALKGDCPPEDALLAGLAEQGLMEQALMELKRGRPRLRSGDPWHLARTHMEAEVARARERRMLQWQLDPARRSLRFRMEVRSPACGLHPPALQAALAQALLEAGLPLAMGLEKTPRPLVRLGHPLPLGVEGLSEWADAALRQPSEVPVPDLAAHINPFCPEGLLILEAEQVPNHASPVLELCVEARWAWACPGPLRGMAEARFARFMAADTYEISKIGKVAGHKQAKRVEVRHLVLDAGWTGDQFRFTTRLSAGEALNPLKLLAGVLGLEAGEIHGLIRTGVELAEDPRLCAGEKYETKLHNIFEDAVLLDSAPEGAAAEEEDDEPILLERTPRSAQGGERPE